MAESERKAESYGPFEILEPLGVGAMATVHRGIERGINGFERVVALKRLLPHLAEDVEFVRGFVREAKLASMLHHGNIVQLYELGRVGASYFISMEYIRGRDLRVILRQARRVCGPPPVEVSIAIITQLLDALDYAHGLCDADGNPLGLIHRDISPANLIISNTGHLKVIDFGIAKATFGHLMTQSGRIKGKLAYMAPETLTGRQLDGRSDLFAASIIAHELLTATPLFAAKDDFQIIDRLQNMQAPAPSTRNPSVPAELDQIVLHGLAKDPDKRWRSAADMRTAIAQFAVDERLLATNREVTSWVDEAFQRQAPVTPSRLRFPLAPPPSLPGEPRQGASSGDTDDEIMDIVWGMSTPRSMPVVLEDVPDVSGKQTLPPTAMATGSDYVNVHRSDQSIILVGTPPGPERPADVRTALGLGPAQSAAAPGPRWAASNPRQVIAPTARTSAPGSVSQQQPQGMLEEAMWAAQRAEAFAMAAMSKGRRRSSLPQFIVAAIAVVAAGGGVAWLVKGRHHEPLVVASTAGQGAQLPATAVQPAPTVQPIPPASSPAAAGAVAAPPAAAAGAPTAAPAPSRLVASAPPAAPGESKASAHAADGENRVEARADDKEDDRGDDRRARRARAKREKAARGRDERDRRRDEEDRELAAAASDERPATEPYKDVPATESHPAASETAPAAPTTTARTETPAERDLDPLPVSVEPPDTEPTRTASTTPARPSGPIIVSASRAQRESGNEHPIRFPPGEQLPPKITAKLCVDTGGTVKSVTVLSSVSAKVRHTVEHALSQWRYRPVTEGGDKVEACFATAFPVQLD
ncbi:MAG TPA: protein kinase [Kofleriaceae bacterium]|nr:protein kinase [Kofleriaceae bacterium]